MTNETQTNTNSVALQALREYVQCLRGDWSDFDGRSNKAALEEFADAIEGNGRAAKWTVEQWRQDSGICPTTGAHWTRHCRPSYCGNDAAGW